jgi:hypothetical protein
MKILWPYENVTVLYGHIHRDHVHDDPHCHHVAARSLIFAFPDPEKTTEKKPLPFDADHPFRHLGPRVLHAAAGAPPSTLALSMEDVELTAPPPRSRGTQRARRGRAGDRPTSARRNRRRPGAV